jgi:hypothetical protein
MIPDPTTFFPFHTPVPVWLLLEEATFPEIGFATQHAVEHVPVNRRNLCRIWKNP